MANIYTEEEFVYRNLRESENDGEKLFKKEKAFLAGDISYQELCRWYSKRRGKNMKKIIVHIWNGLMFLLTGKGTFADEMIEAGVIDYSGQGRDSCGH